MNNELASKPNRRDIRDLIQSETVQNQVKLALPTYLTAERMLRICVTSVNRNPKLLECTPESLLGAIMTAAQMGLEPDGRNGHLVPYFNKKANVMECQFQADFKGLVTLVRRNPEVLDVYADLVRDKDKFSITKGLHRDLVHEIDVRADRGEIIGAYAVLQYRSGTSSFEFMSLAEVNAIKARSKSPDYGPWATDFGEMAKKTVIKRLLKLADLSPDTRDRLSVEDEISINDRVTEIAPIQRAQIEAPPTEKKEYRLNPPAAESPTQTTNNEEPTTASEPEPAKKRGRPPGKLKPKEQPAPEPSAAPAEKVLNRGPNEEKVFTLLGEAGYLPADAVAVCLANDWETEKDKPTTLADLGERVLAEFVSDWATVVEEIQKLPKYADKGEASPFK